jgi:acyl-coenzyme A thioesterase PaaI-like protein
MVATVGGAASALIGRSHDVRRSPSSLSTWDRRAGHATLACVTDVQTALALRRETGAPLLGLLLDLRQAATGPAAIELEGVSAWGPLGVTELATLSDLALGAALRRKAGTATLLPTITLTLELDRDAPGCDATVCAEAEPTVDGTAGAVGRLRSADGVLGRCMATFVVGSREADVPPLPWEINGRVPASASSRGREERLTDAEAAVLAALDHASAGSLEARLLRLQWQSEDGRSQGALEPGIALLNRAGHVQGGATVGLAVAAARAASSRPARLASAHVQFVRPALARRLQVVGRLVRGGRRTSFATVELSQDDRVVATASVTLAHDQARRTA